MTEQNVIVDTDNEPFSQQNDQIEKSDSDEGDFEVISKEQFDKNMADTQNGVGNANKNGGERRFSITEDGEATDKFPQKINNKSSNWNFMELGEKRKRLR